jgi:hypothetical protein
VAQSGAPIGPDKLSHDPTPTAPPDANAQMQMLEQPARQQSYAAANTERKRQLADDSARLLKLANDLNVEVDKKPKTRSRSA